MQITVDKVNNAVIATGRATGKTIKVVAACREQGDVFNEEFGRELVKRKYKIKERDTKIAAYLKNIKVYKRIIKKIEAKIAVDTEQYEKLNELNQKEKKECNDFIEQYYEKL